MKKSVRQLTIMVMVFVLFLSAATAFAARRDLPKEEIALEGVMLRDSVDKVVQIFGKPRSINNNTYYFDGLEVGIIPKENVVYGATCINPQYKTPRGIAVGDTIQKAKEAYGDALEFDKSYPAYRMGTVGSAFIMEFHINANNVITKIRMADWARP